MLYKLGDKIKFRGDPESDYGEIIAAHLTNGSVLYTISTREWDVSIRHEVPAVKHIEESEAVLYEKIN